MKQQPRVCIAGMGAIGCTLASKLVGKPLTVSVVARGKTLHALQNVGLVSDVGGVVNKHYVQADIKAPGSEQDIIFLAGKSYQLPDLLDTVKHAIGPKTKLIPVVNGLPWWLLDKTNTNRTAVKQIASLLDPEKKLSSLPLKNIIGCVAYAFSRIKSPASVVVAHSPRFMLGHVEKTESGLRDIISVINTADEVFQESLDIKKEVWNKLALNAATNFLSVLCETTLEGLSGNGGIQPLLKRSLLEVQALGQDCGIAGLLSVEDLLLIIAKGGNHPTSMLQDYLDNRPLEFAALGDAVVALAQHHGLILPTTEALLRLTRDKASKRY